MDLEAPEGWITSTLEEVVESQKGKVPKEFSDEPRNGFVPYIDIEAFETGRVKRYATTEGTTVATDQDVFIVWDGARFGLSGKFPGGALGSTLVRLHSECLERDYLLHFVRHHYKTINSRPRGTGTPHVEPDVFWPLRIGIPPEREQTRIVEKIETLFARLDKGEEALRDVSTLLVRYRQSVLKAAVTGKLTADWRAENAHRLEHGRDLLARILQTRRETWDGRGKYKEPTAPDTTDLPELPEGWVWASVGQLANVMGGLTKNKERQEMPLRKPMLRVANVYQNRLELDDIHLAGITASECARVLLEDLDLLVVEGNGSKDQIGRMAIWRNEIPDAVHQNHLIKVRMIEKGLVEFALWWFQSPNGRQNIEKVASSTSGLYTLSISKIEALVVPVPSLVEIEEINELVDEAFSKISQLETWCQTELARSAALRQSILKDAFAGRLVPQDPTDEPAAALLARIKATRSASSGRVRKAQE